MPVDCWAENRNALFIVGYQDAESPVGVYWSLKTVGMSPCPIGDGEGGKRAFEPVPCLLPDRTLLPFRPRGPERNDQPAGPVLPSRKSDFHPRGRERPPCPGRTPQEGPGSAPAKKRYVVDLLERAGPPESQKFQLYWESWPWKPEGYRMPARKMLLLWRPGSRSAARRMWKGTMTLN